MRLQLSFASAAVLALVAWTCSAQAGVGEIPGNFNSGWQFQRNALGMLAQRDADAQSAGAEFQRAVHEEYPGDQAFSAGWQNDGYDIYIQARQHHLRHPPFTFKLGKFTPGSLEAVGYISGRSVARHRVITPGAIERIQIEFDNAGVCTDAERSDQIFVRARVVDSNGTTVPVSDRQIEFSASGRFAIVGPTRLMTEAGIATALVQVSPGAGEANISASNGVQRLSATYRDSGCRQVFRRSP